MSELKKFAQTLNPSAEPAEIERLVAATGNIYESLFIIAKRSRAISSEIKKELHEKLGEFASQIENLEEINENKEQIEISKFYERLPNPATIATAEFLQDKLHYEHTNEKVEK